MERLTGQTAPDLPPSHYLDNRIYSDTEIFALERAHIFAGRWKFVCHVSEIEAPGDFRLVNVAGHEIIMLRGADTELRAFYNSCAHRGAQVLRQPVGNLNNHRMTCFYHWWSYDDHGRCVIIPEPEGYRQQKIDKAQIGLRQVRVATIFGLLFVCLDDNCAPLEDYLGPDLIAAMHIPFGMADLEVFHFHRVELHANWKLFVETNAEGYHELLHTLNRTTAVAVDEYRQRKWLRYDNGHMSLEPALISYGRNKLESREAHTLPGMEANGHTVVDIFPDVMLNCRSTVIRIDSLVPVSPELTVLECRGLGLRDDGDEARSLRVRHHNQVWGPTGSNLAEDVWAVQAQMANMATGTSRYSLIAREEDGSMDDAPLRAFYAEWSRLVGRHPANLDAHI